MPRPPTPAGFGSWLDYAVETMDTRTALMEHLFEGRGSVVARVDQAGGPRRTDRTSASRSQVNRLAASR